LALGASEAVVDGGRITAAEEQRPNVDAARLLVLTSGTMTHHWRNTRQKEEGCRRMRSPQVPLRQA
jgi:hypothetical protein